VRPEECQGAGAQAQGRGQERVLHVRGVHELFLPSSAGRCARARRQRRPRQDYRCARELDLRWPRHAVRTDQVRQWPEPGRGTGEHAGTIRRYPGDPASGLCLGKAGVPVPPDLGRLRGRRAAPPMSSILVPAVLNGLLTGAVYALVALGLTLIYGVLHIINFAHGALLTAALFAAFFAHALLGLDPYIVALAITPLFFVIGYALQRLVIGPAGRGDDRKILL